MSPSSFIFDGGNLALDFVNTRPISDGEHLELLATPAHLDAWLAEARVHPRRAVTKLSVRLQARLLVDAHALRDAVERCATALRDGTAPPSAAVETLNGILATDRRSIAVRALANGFQRVELSHPLEAAALLAPIAVAAVELLTSAPPGRVGQCDHPDCVLWFLDTTRNGGRRWCSMTRCGNRAKVAAHYRRRKAKGRS